MGSVAGSNMFPPNDVDGNQNARKSIASSVGSSARFSAIDDAADTNQNQVEGDRASVLSNDEQVEDDDLDADPSKTRFVSVPFFWSVQFGQSLRFAGHNAGFDDVVVHGNPVFDQKNPDPVFVAFYLIKNRVVAAASLNKDPIVAQFAEALRIGAKVSREHVADEPEGFTKLLN